MPSFPHEISALISSPPTARVDIEREDERLVLLVASGEFDLATSDLLRAALVRQLLAGRRSVALDMSGVGFMDVVAIDVIIEVQREFIAAGATMLIVNPSRQVSRLLRLAGLDQKLLEAHRAATTAARHG